MGPPKCGARAIARFAPPLKPALIPIGNTSRDNTTIVAYTFVYISIYYIYIYIYIYIYM